MLASECSEWLEWKFFKREREILGLDKIYIVVYVSYLSIHMDSHRIVPYVHPMMMGQRIENEERETCHAIT